MIRKLCSLFNFADNKRITKNLQREYTKHEEIILSGNLDILSNVVAGVVIVRAEGKTNENFGKHRTKMMRILVFGETCTCTVDLRTLRSL